VSPENCFVKIEEEGQVQDLEARDYSSAAIFKCEMLAKIFGGSSLNSVGKGITIYHNPRSNKSLCPSPRKNSSG
jgi:hypothetical protein